MFISLFQKNNILCRGVVSDEGGGLIEPVYIKQFEGMPPYIPDMARKPKTVMVCADFNNDGRNECAMTAMVNLYGQKVVSIYSHNHTKQIKTPKNYRNVSFGNARLMGAMSEPPL
jgi:hypothetical protein